MTYKTLPAPSKSNWQVREYTSAVEQGFKSVFVRPSSHGWRVILVSNQKVVGTFSDKSSALREAKKQAQALDGTYFVFNDAGELVATN
jgi:hypothetical protein